MDIDWSAPVPEDPYGLSPEWSTLYGTPLWDRLDPSERVTLTIHEYCSISGIGIWFEHLLVQLVLRDIYGDDPAQPHVQWALTEIADECRHSVMFARTAQTFGAPSYGPPPALLELGKAYAARADGPAAYAAILVAEEILDIFQRDLMEDDRVQPLHAGDQPDPRRRGGAAHALRARGGRPAHARAVLLAAAQAPDLVAACAAIVAEISVQPQVYASVGLDPREARAAARANEHYNTRLRDASAGLVAFLRGVGLIAGPSERLWKRAGLL